MTGRPAARGFTLVELLVTVAIVAVLAAAAWPVQALVARRAQEAELRVALRTLRGALDAHRDAVEVGRIARPPHGTPWPARLEDLVTGVPLADENGRADAQRGRLYLLRRLPRDPFADPALPAADTWATRASDTPPDAPRAGADVFDVSSSSPVVALDGTRVDGW